MNKLNIYVIRDEVSQENSFVCTAINDEEAKRNIRLALCSPQPNYVNQHTKDKRLVLVGSIDVDTGKITAEDSPVLLCTVEEVRLELIHEIAAAKSQALDELLKAGITKDKYQQACDLINSLKVTFEDKKEDTANA